MSLFPCDPVTRWESSCMQPEPQENQIPPPPMFSTKTYIKAWTTDEGTGERIDLGTHFVALDDLAFHYANKYKQISVTFLNVLPLEKTGDKIEIVFHDPQDNEEHDKAYWEQLARKHMRNQNVIVLPNAGRESVTLIWPQNSKKAEALTAAASLSKEELLWILQGKD